MGTYRICFVFVQNSKCCKPRWEAVERGRWSKSILIHCHSSSIFYTATGCKTDLFYFIGMDTLSGLITQNGHTSLLKKGHPWNIVLCISPCCPLSHNLQTVGVHCFDDTSTLMSFYVISQTDRLEKYPKKMSPPCVLCIMQCLNYRPRVVV